MNKRKKKVILWFLIILFVITFLYYQFILSQTIAIVTIENKVQSNNKNIITIRFEDNRTQNIKAPDIVWPFLEIGLEYSVTYKHNLLRRPFLTRIEPME